jgi:hypothetical protein
MQGTMCGEQRSSSAIGYCARGRGASSPPCDEEGMGALGSSYLRSRGTQRERRPRRLGRHRPTLQRSVKGSSSCRGFVRTGEDGLRTLLSRCKDISVSA